MPSTLDATVLERLRVVVGATGVSDARELHGGTHAVTHLVRFRQPGVKVVVQQYPCGDNAAQRSADVLAALDGLGGWAPRLIAIDPEGSWSGRPTVVMTALPGDSSLRLGDGVARCTNLGETMAAAHAHDISDLAHLDRVLERPGGSLESVSGPARDAVEAVWPQLAAEPLVLTHYDFWAGNVLWAGNEVTGVIDWSGAGLGPRGFDVSWSRLDAYLLWGVEAADALLASYEASTRRPVSDRRMWDLVAAGHAHGDISSWEPNYAGLGRHDLTGELLRDKLATWTEDLSHP